MYDLLLLLEIAVYLSPLYAVGFVLILFTLLDMTKNKLFIILASVLWPATLIVLFMLLVVGMIVQ